MISITPPTTCAVTKAINHDSSRSNSTSSSLTSPGGNGGVGIEESNLATKIDVYPNPSTNEFNVSIELNVDQNFIVNIYDLKGSLVKSYNMNSPQFIIDLKDFESGMYILEINLDYGVIRKQLIKK